MRRALIQSEISDAIEKGAADFYELSMDDDTHSLQEQFNAVSSASEHLLENFYPFKFWARRNFDKPEGELKTMLLGAFESVSFMRALNDNIGLGNLNYRQNRIVIERQREKLSSAYHVYVTNGQSVNIGRQVFSDYMRSLLNNKRGLSELVA